MSLIDTSVQVSKSTSTYWKETKVENGEWVPGAPLLYICVEVGRAKKKENKSGEWRMGSGCTAAIYVWRLVESKRKVENGENGFRGDTGTERLTDRGEYRQAESLSSLSLLNSATSYLSAPL
jgi:hypothetical protein